MVLKTTLVSALTAIIAVFITYALTRRREHEAEWRKMKFSQYQELALAISGMIGVRAGQDAQRRYADAFNSTSLVAATSVLRALRAFQDEITSANKNRSDQREHQLLDNLIRTMRQDIDPTGAPAPADYQFMMIGLPPENV